MPDVRVPPGAEAAWLSVGAASRRLGVDPDTLRRWAESGQVEAFTTPGGHRRFSRASLDRLANRRTSTRRSSAVELSGSSARITAAYRRRYLHAGSEGLVSAVAPSETDRESFRVAGRSLVAALVRYVDAGTDEERARAEVDARDGTVAFADRVASRPIGVSDAIAAFVSARRPFLSEIARISRRRSLSAAEVSELYERSGELLDRLVILFAATITAGDDR